MKKSMFLTVVTVFATTSSLCSASLCPHNDEVTGKIEELAHEGKATFPNGTYHLIGRDQTSIFLTERILENDAQLNGFLKVSQLLDKNLPKKAEAHLINLVPTPNFCAYKVSLGENVQVIALLSDK